MKLIAVNGRKWTPDVLRDAIKAAQGNTAPIDLLVQNGKFFQSYSVSYHEGAQNPHLEPVSGQAHLLEKMLVPLTH